ncbi:MAG: FixH family protein [Myxococcota bacterium]
MFASCEGSGSKATPETPSKAHEAKEAAKPGGALEGVSTSKRYSVTLTPNPNPPPMNTIFTVEAKVMDRKGNAPLTGAKVKVDATMPAHRHGMMTRPTHTEVGDGVYRSEGMKLHMPGEWVYRVDIETKDGEDHVMIPYNQPAMNK